MTGKESHAKIPNQKATCNRFSIQNTPTSLGKSLQELNENDNELTYDSPPKPESCFVEWKPAIQEEGTEKLEHRLHKARKAIHQVDPGGEGVKWLSSFLGGGCTPWKINMEPENDGLEFGR